MISGGKKSHLWAWTVQQRCHGDGGCQHNSEVTVSSVLRVLIVRNNKNPEWGGVKAERSGKESNQPLVLISTKSPDQNWQDPVSTNPQPEWGILYL